jgi:large subunit ribosomal protein L13e
MVHGATVKYNSKVRIGRGFSLAEIKDVGLSKAEAKSLGIAVDHRRRNRSVQGKSANVQRLREYKANLVVFPRHKDAKKGWKNDAAEEETTVAEQLTGRVIMKPVKAVAEVETRKLTAEEADPKTRVTRQLKAAWNDARLVGFREKRAKERADKEAQEALKKAK